MSSAVPSRQTAAVSPDGETERTRAHRDQHQLQLEEVVEQKVDQSPAKLKTKTKMRTEAEWQSEVVVRPEQVVMDCQQ